MATKKTVAFLINHLGKGGAERVVSILLPKLTTKYNIYLVMINDGELAYEYAGNLEKLAGEERDNRFLYLFDLLRAKRKLKETVKRCEIDCLISLLDVPNLLNILTGTGCKKIICIHSYGNPDSERKVFSDIKDKMCRRLFRKADRVICVSEKISQMMERDYHIDKAKISTIVNPYDIKCIDSASIENMDKKTESFYRGHRVIVSMGRLSAGKGFADLIGCFKELQKKYDNIGLVIVGEGEERRNIESKINDLKLQDSVLLTGIKENPFPYIKNAELFVLSSIYEGFPNALVEAMACGKPVIARDCLSGPREILCQEYDIDKTAEEVELADYGILVPDLYSRNSMGIVEKDRFLVQAMELLLGNQELRDNYGKKAKERAAVYSVERCVEKYEKVIDEVLLQDG